MSKLSIIFISTLYMGRICRDGASIWALALSEAEGREVNSIPNMEWDSKTKAVDGGLA